MPLVSTAPVALGLGVFSVSLAERTRWTLEPPVAQGYALVSAHVCTGRGGRRRVFPDPVVFP